MAMLPSQNQLMTVGYTLLVLWAVHNVGMLSGAKKVLNFDQ